MIGNSNNISQNENAKFDPQSPYGVSKVFAHQVVKNYRDAYGLYACCAISFNHESRSEERSLLLKK